MSFQLASVNSRTPTTATVLLALLCFLSLSSVSAQDDFFNSLDIDIATNEESDSPHSFLGWINTDIGYGLQAPGALFSRSDSELNKAELSLFGQWDITLGERSSFRFSGKAYHDEVYRLQDHNNYAADETSEFRNRFEIRDLYVEHEFDNGVYVKAGNQILAWGMSEYLRVTDLINVENQYTFGQQDLEDLRLQVPALLSSVNINGLTLDAVFTYEAGGNDIAPAGDEFDQFVALRALGTQLHRSEPEKQHEVFFRLSGQTAHGDFQLVAGEFNDNGFSLQRIAGDTHNPEAFLGQNRMRALGLALNRVAGPWLLFSEIGIHKDKTIRPVSNAFAIQAQGWQQKDQWLGVFGADYSGFRNLTLSAEVDVTRTLDNSRILFGPATQTSIGLRAYWTAMNERLQLVAVSNQLAENLGRIDRLSVDYDWSDSLSLGLLWVNYTAPVNSYVHLFSRNDVLNVRFRYSFQSN